MAEACNFTKSIKPPWVFFTFFKLCKCDQIAQTLSYIKIRENGCQKKNDIYDSSYRQTNYEDRAYNYKQ